MSTVGPAVRERQTALLREFGTMGLDVRKVWSPEPGAPQRENAQLGRLLHWARAFRAHGDRRKMERLGLRFPPVEPDLDPDSDWLRFERWMQGEDVEWRYADRFGALPPAEALGDAALEREYRLLVERLASMQVAVEFMDGVPLRRRYEYLRGEALATPFAYLAPGTTLHLTGCGGDCESCFQCPWCDIAHEFEDEEEDDED